ncbi:hypothetical protein SAMN05892883_3977 [Jatrophihabitans sp. GAS493]|nr:hypothetical protein [Jatrophihabitans sp. GAS493]SOD74786.1 hypothetical protein SAMN05892883_3977 [Jatrophihabitans sp. GAS493]
MAEQAKADPTLAQRQPYQAAVAHDLHWLGAAMVKHYRGDDADLKLLMGAVESAFVGMSIDDFTAEVGNWLATSTHPVLRRPYLNSNGDVQMLRFARSHDRAGLRLLVDHDDADREFAYPDGAEEAMNRATERGWTVVSMKSDWSRIFN